MPGEVCAEVPLRRVSTLAALVRAAEQRRAVIVMGWGGRRFPAAFVVSLQARLVYDLARAGMFLWPRARGYRPRPYRPWRKGLAGAFGRDHIGAERPLAPDRKGGG